jgi:metal transporter CNNM
MSPFVLVLMWIMSPVAWPTAKLLDYLLGDEHGTMYNKPGLKTLVTLHKTLGSAPGDGLMEDEVTIINSVLDLKDKPVGDIMTPMQDVFIMSADTVLDEKMMDIILSQGYSRIPIYAPDNSRNFIGMLLVKILITYDPEDAKRVRDFALATLPETGPYTSCLDIINFFQEGKSHMVLVSDFPGDDKGALGVVTLEDVIEELIGEEIIDESDVFVDVHKAIRRMAPAPRTRYGKSPAAIESDPEATDPGEDTPLLNKESRTEVSSRKPSLVNSQQQTFLMRRKSSNASDSTRDTVRPTAVRGSAQELRRHLTHLGPSNMASKPRTTKYTSVKIKPGVGTIPEGAATTTGVDDGGRSRSVSEVQQPAPAGGSEGAELLKDAGKDATNGIAALQANNTALRPGSSRRVTAEVEAAEGASEAPAHLSAAEASKLAGLKTSSDPPETAWQSNENSRQSQDNGSIVIKGEEDDVNGSSSPKSKLQTSPAKDKTRLDPSSASKNDKLVIGPPHNVDNDDEDNEADDDQVGDMQPARDRSKSRRTARSGSITETTVDMNGYKKTVLETTSSSDDDGAAVTSPSATRNGSTQGSWLSNQNDSAAIAAAEDKPNGGADSANASVNGSAGSSSGGKNKKKNPSKKKKKNKNDF